VNVFGAVRRALGRTPPNGRPYEPTVTADDVVFAYRLFLERLPENDAVVAEKLAENRTLRELRQCFMLSREFRRQHADHTYLSDTFVVIREFPEGFRLVLDISDVYALEIAKGVYEPSEVAFVRSRVKPGDVALDIGGHMGYYAFLMAALAGPTGQVTTFEALTENADLIERSIDENRWGDRVRLVRAAVSDRPGEVEFAFLNDEVNLGIAHIVDDNSKDPDLYVIRRAPSVAIDELELRRPVRFIKMDIEGAELRAVRGMARLLGEDRPVLLTELNRPQLAEVSHCTPADYIAEVEAIGYHCHRLRDGAPAERIADVTEMPNSNVVFLPAQ
jgi:FkbM family methyltransferase